MSTYKITFEKSAVKFLKKQNVKIQESILKAISNLPDGTDIKKLKGYNLHRMRVGNIRVIYFIDNVVQIINIQNIDNRGDVYKKL